MHLQLVSASARRAELLKQIGIPFKQYSVDIDESATAGENAKDYLKRVVNDKLKAAEQLPGIKADQPILVADTVVVKEHHIFGKPVDYAQAEQMLLSLSNDWHQVLTSCVIKHHGKILNKVRETWVKFRKLNRNDIDDYWACGEPRGKAGSYAIQGKGAVFVEQIQGSYSGVMGLDVFDVYMMLSELDWQY